MEVYLLQNVFIQNSNRSKLSYNPVLTNVNSLCGSYVLIMTLLIFKCGRCVRKSMSMYCFEQTLQSTRSLAVFKLKYASVDHFNRTNSLNLPKMVSTVNITLIKFCTNPLLFFYSFGKVRTQNLRYGY